MAFYKWKYKSNLKKIEKENNENKTKPPALAGIASVGRFEIKSKPFYDCESIKDPIYLFI